MSKRLPIKRLKKEQSKNECLASKKDIALLKTLKERFTEQELKTIIKSGFDVNNLQNQKAINLNFTGEKIKFGVISDTHIGSIYFKEKMLFKALEIFHKEKCKFITHSGDVSDGLSNRQGHIYELTHIGYTKQRQYCQDLLSKTNLNIYAIDGNHDRYYQKSSGALLVKDLSERLKNFYFLGHDFGEFYLNKNIKVCLWHGEDGNSYATSYRLQKIIESFTGGDKPNLLIAGHTHKQGYFFDRHIHVISAGALSLQSRWMKSKRIANHTGFWIVELTFNYKSIVRCNSEWFPFYV